MNYQPVVTGNQLNSSAGIQGNFDADPQNSDTDAAFADKENESEVHGRDSKAKRDCLVAAGVGQRVLATKPHNKTPYEPLLGETPSIGFMRPLSCHVSILNTVDPLGKFDGKADEGFLVGYSVSSKAFRVLNSKTIIVQDTLHINFLENQPNIVGSRPIWLFDIDTLTRSMNYQRVVTWNQPNSTACIQEHFDAGKAGEGNVQQYVLFPLWSTGSKDPHNTNADATFEVKEPESDIHVSPNSSAKTKKHNDKNYLNNTNYLY
nr:ribonuclease H-like domain-containing protein [Tanacetum cinerariifolium]